MTKRRQNPISEGVENAQPHVIYDLSLPLPERREKAIVFRSIAYLARHFKVSSTTIYTHRKIGKRFKDANGKEWAIRVATPEMIERLKK